MLEYNYLMGSLTNFSGRIRMKLKPEIGGQSTPRFRGGERKQAEVSQQSLGSETTETAKDS